MRYILTPVRMTTIKSLPRTNTGKGVEKETLPHCRWEWTLVQSLTGETVRRFLGKLEKWNYHTIQQSHSWADTRQNYNSQRYMQPYIQAAPFTIAKKWKQSKYH